MCQTIGISKHYSNVALGVLDDVIFKYLLSLVLIKQPFRFLKFMIDVPVNSFHIV